MDRRLCLLTAFACLLTAVPLPAQEAVAPFAIEETGAGFDTLAEAVAAIGDGEGTILIAPGRYRQCASQRAGDIAYVARQAGTATFDGVACEGKAALVLAGRTARVDGLIFENIRVPGADGAGIRVEAGDLTVRETMFRDGESGLLIAEGHEGTVRVAQSTFSGLGRCQGNGRCTYAIHSEGNGALIVSRTLFERSPGRRYLQSRRVRIEVTDSRFDDGTGQVTNAQPQPW